MLTPSAIKNARAAAKAYKLTDERGMYLLVKPNGSRWWRFDYRRPSDHRRNTLSLGTYPEVSLKQARERRDEARSLVANGVDPSQQRKASVTAKANTFEAIAREWYEQHVEGWAKTHSSKVWRRLEKDAFPWLGAKAIADISAPDVLHVMRHIDARGARETAHRVHQTIGQVMRYAIATGRLDTDVTVMLRGALPAATPTHYATITEPRKVAALLRAIDGYEGNYVTRAALKLAPLVFVRPGELRQAEWSHIDLERAEWRIPRYKMKMRKPHIVPLSTQAIAVLADLHPVTGRSKYVFPSVRARIPERCMSENTVNAALRNLGYPVGSMTGHGFRAMASTLLNEQGWPEDVIERALAHTDNNKVRAAYNHAQYLPERRRMLQVWADYLDELRDKDP